MILEKQSYKQSIEKINNLPSLPEVAVKLLKLIEDPRASASDVADLISQDVSLSAKVLKLANSAFYGIPKTITTVKNAVVLLGTKVVNSLILSISIQEVFPESKNHSGLQRKKFWEHSMAVAICNKLVAEKASINALFDPEEAFCSGLLHDIGRLVYDKNFSEGLSIAFKNAETAQVSLYLSEQQTFGFNHSDVADWLTSKWDLPNSLRIPVIYHHSPHLAPTHIVNAFATHLSDFICHSLNYSHFESEVYGELHKDCLLQLGIRDEDILFIKQKLPEEIVKLKSSFHMN